MEDTQTPTSPFLGFDWKSNATSFVVTVLAVMAAIWLMQKIQG